MRLLLLVVFAHLALAGPARSAAGLPHPLPIRYPHLTGSDRPAAPAYAGDVMEIRLSSAAARRAVPAYRAGGRRAALGIASLDRLALELGGVRFEPEFPGETAPEPGGRAPDFTAFYIAHLPPGVALETALERFAALPEVASAEPIAVLPVSAVPNDSLWSSSYYFFQPSRRDLHAPEAWDVTRGDTAVVVGILDTGVVPYHPDLGGVTPGVAGQMWTNWSEKAGVPGVDDDGNGYVDDFHGWDFVHVGPNDAALHEDYRDPDNDPNDFVAHGTGVAGLVGALTDNLVGVAGTCWNVRLMPLRVGWAYPGSSLGSGEVRMDFVAQAVRYATRMGAQVINCSFASLNQSGLGLALDEATAAGVTVVCSAGNTGQSDYIYIASRPDAVCVASVGPTDVVSSFSLVGPHVDLAAPGEAMQSTWLMPRPPSGDSIAFRQPSYRTTLNGTSFAAPLVAGASALLQARRLQQGRYLLPPEAILLRFDETTDDISAQNPTLGGQYGSGRLNLERALKETWGSTAVRLGARVSGPAAVLATNLGGTRLALVTRDDHLAILDGATLDTVATASLAGVATSGVTAGPRSAAGGTGLFVSLQGGVAGLRPDGAPLPGWPVSVPAEELQLRGCALGDLDGDGGFEVVCGSEAGRVWAWRMDGAVVAGFPAQVASSPVNPVAIARFGAAAGTRIIATAEDGTVAALGSDGAMLAGWPRSVGSSPTSPVETGMAGGPTALVAAGGQLHALGPDGNQRPGFPVGLGAPVEPGEELALADVDLDGRDEIVAATEAPALEVRDSTGAARSDLGWPRSLGAIPLGSPVLGHLAGGGRPELMVMLGSGLVAYAHDGAAILGFPKRGGAGVRPTLADLDGDGTTEVVAGSGPAQPLLYVYDAGPGSSAAAPQPWPTLRGNAARTGSRSYAPAAVVDVIPPGTILDLSASVLGDRVVLNWTAPADDDGGITRGQALAVGRVAEYDVRSSLLPITPESFESGERITAVSGPSDPGVRDTAVALFPPGAAMMSFAVRAHDQDGNRGAISNVVMVTPGIPLPQAIALAPLGNPARARASFSWRAAPEGVGSAQRLRIHDLGGRLVRTIELGAGTGGVAQWDGRDSEGHRVAAGIYLVRLVSGPRHVQRRLVLLP
jgi:hypothetical protein